MTRVDRHTDELQCGRKSALYTLFDPPISPFSPPTAIREWIQDLEALSVQPEYAPADAREQLDSALAQAREWLEISLDVHGRGRG